MAKRKIGKPDAPSPPVLRAWHVISKNGGGTTVAAHKCASVDGVLAFHRFEDRRGLETEVLVRGYAPNEWADVALVEDLPLAESAE